MRRRIYIDPEGPLRDKTDSPYLWDLDQEPSEELGVCRTGALYDEDEELWQRYLAAVKLESELHSQVCAKLVNHPWDETEIKIGTRSQELLNISWHEGSDESRRARNEEMDALGEAALAHAKTVTKP